MDWMCFIDKIKSDNIIEKYFSEYSFDEYRTYISYTFEYEPNSNDIRNFIKDFVKNYNMVYKSIEYSEYNYDNGFYFDETIITIYFTKEIKNFKKIKGYKYIL